jgi:hypothetical protein
LGGASLALASLAAGSRAAAQPTQQVVLPGPVPYPTTSPPLTGRGLLAQGYLTPGLRVASTERVRIGVDQSGKPARIDVRQRLVVAGKGDYQLAVAAPLVSIRRGPGSESEPGFRVDQVLWAGFSPGRKVLASDVVLRTAPAARYLPLRLRLQRTRDGAALTVTNVTITPELRYVGVVRPPEAAKLLDATRRASLAGVRLRGAFVTFVGPVSTSKQPLVIEAPFRVEGELRLPGGRPVSFSRVLGDGRPLSFTVRTRGSGPPVVRLRAWPAPVVLLLQPRGASTWAAAVKRRVFAPDLLLKRLLETRMRLVRTDQYQTYLADPDADGRGRAVYEYQTVAVPAPQRPAVPARSDGGGSSVLLIVLVIAGSLVAVGGGLVLWAHS